ncbi:hypothetical protein WBG78_19055 [Chryseolinea sp. T2]|uniref:hypothetical protein n=1 Tax=Chryseolinea sp. T2 TaxID=3129255 RepID=UPI0030784A48
MKTILTSAFILCACLMQAQDKYTSAMLKNIDALYKSKTSEEYQSSVNAFDRIASTEKNKFEPYYYAAFGNIMMAVNETVPGKKDNYLDLASANVDKAKTIKPNDSEIIALEGFVHMIRVTVDPQSRGQEYSGKAFTAFNKAVALNPENPRALALLGQMQLGTARFFGNDSSEACATSGKALEKFASYRPASALAPHWGQVMAEEVKSTCK